jgi:hypothetical protein
MTVKERRRSEPGGFSSYEYFRGGDANSRVESNPFLIPDYVWLHEKMTPNSSGVKSEWKNFEHYKMFRSSKPNIPGVLVLNAEQQDFFPDIHTASTSDARTATFGFQSNGATVPLFGTEFDPLSGLPSYLEERADGGFIPQPADLDQLNRWALRSMYPAVKENLSLLNSLFELKDFKTFPKFLKDLVTRKLFITSGQSTLRGIVRGAADVHLQTKFNILPLIDDVLGIRRALAETERRVNDLLSRAGKTQTSHYMRRLDENGDTREDSQTFWAFPPNNGVNNPYTFGRSTRYVTNQPTVFHAEMQYNYIYTAYQTEHAQLLGLLDSLGVNLNPQIIWNAIPWSFVVDWLANVGSFLSQLKSRNLEPQINILRYLWSVRRSRRVSFTVQYFDGGTIHDPTYSSWRPPVSAPVITETAYRRHCEMPTLSSIELSGLNPNEFSLGASLVLSRRRRSRRH